MLRLGGFLLLSVAPAWFHARCFLLLFHHYLPSFLSPLPAIAAPLSFSQRRAMCLLPYAVLLRALLLRLFRAYLLCAYLGQRLFVSLSYTRARRIWEEDMLPAALLPTASALVSHHLSL